MNKKDKPKDFTIKEGASGAFFVKLGNSTLGGFQQREHAELFLSAIKGELVPKDQLKLF